MEWRGQGGIPHPLLANQRSTVSQMISKELGQTKFFLPFFVQSSPSYFWLSRTKVSLLCVDMPQNDCQPPLAYNPTYIIPISFQQRFYKIVC